MNLTYLMRHYKLFRACALFSNVYVYIYIFIYLGSYVTAALPSYNRAYHTGNTGIQ